MIFLLFLNSFYCTYHESTSVEQGQCLGQYLILEDLPKSTFCTKFFRCSKSERCSCHEVNRLLGLREDKGMYSLSVASLLLSMSVLSRNLHWHESVQLHVLLPIYVMLLYMGTKSGPLIMPINVISKNSKFWGLCPHEFGG